MRKSQPGSSHALRMQNKTIQGHSAEEHFDQKALFAKSELNAKKRCLKGNQFKSVQEVKVKK